MVETLTDRAIGRATLARQMLLERADVRVLDAVERLVGLQAQAPFSPYYGLWSRVDGFGPDDLAQRIIDRSVVRIVVMRGTVHLVSADDCVMLRGWLQPTMERDLDKALGARGIDGVDLGELAAVARKLLEDAPLTPAELTPQLVEHFPDAKADGLMFAVRTMLALVQPPPRAVWGQSGAARLTTVEAWLGRSIDRAPDPAAIVRRYLAGFGPASVADLQTWSGLTRLREVVDPLRDELVAFRDEQGKELFDLPDAPRPGPDTPAPPRFLPDFDNLLRSHAARSRVISDDDRKRIATKNGVSPHTVLVDGRYAGIWRINQEPGRAVLAIDLHHPVNDDDRGELVAEGHRLLDFAAPDATGEVVVGG